MQPVDLKISIIAAMARTLWAEAWLIYKYPEGVPIEEDDLDNAPITPPSVFHHAESLARVIERKNAVTLDTLFALALYADLRDRIAPRKLKSFDELVNLFGHHLVRQSLGIESQWFTEHANFGLKIPAYTEIEANASQIIRFVVSDN